MVRFCISGLHAFSMCEVPSLLRPKQYHSGLLCRWYGQCQRYKEAVLRPETEGYCRKCCQHEGCFSQPAGKALLITNNPFNSKSWNEKKQNIHLEVSKDSKAPILKSSCKVADGYGNRNYEIHKAEWYLLNQPISF